jgi:hypothetical protein
MALTDKVVAAGDHQLLDGVWKTVQGTDQAAGVEMSETIPTGKAWRVYAVFISVVASAVAGTRRTQLTVDDGTNIIARSVDAAGFPANAIRNYSYFQNALDINLGDSLTSTTALWPDMVLGPGYRIRTITAGLDVGDNYGPPLFYVIEYQIA